MPLYDWRKGRGCTACRAYFHDVVNIQYEIRGGYRQQYRHGVTGNDDVMTNDCRIPRIANNAVVVTKCGVDMC